MINNSMKKTITARIYHQPDADTNQWTMECQGGYEPIGPTLNTTVLNTDEAQALANKVFTTTPATEVVIYWQGDANPLTLKSG